MRIALFNDTGRYPHVGCRAVSSGHDRMLEQAGITVAYRSFYGEWRAITDGGVEALRDHLASVDAVVVNGEGTIHHRGGRHLLAILREAQGMGLPTFLVNAVLQDCEAVDVLRGLTDCTVRDLASSDYLRQAGVSHRVVFDSMLEAHWTDKASVDLDGQIVVTDWHGSRADVGDALRGLLHHPLTVFYPFQDDERAGQWAHTVADIRPAKLVVTGRHHGVCVAALAGVPFVALGSNTWKVEGLLALMPGTVSVCDPQGDLGAVCEAAMADRETFAAIHDWAWAQQPLTTFDGLRAVA